MLLNFNILLGMLTLVLSAVMVTPARADDSEFPQTLDGLEFRSIKKFVVSVLPTGPVMSHRKLKFREGEFTYVPSDYIDTGKYDWDAKRGEVEAKSMGGKAYKGKYNLETKILTWEGEKYKVVTPKEKDGHDKKSDSNRKP